MLLDVRLGERREIPLDIVAMYRLPSSVIDESRICDIDLRFDKSDGHRNTFVYSEMFQSHIVSVIHLYSLIKLIEDKELVIFFLNLDPIFDAKFIGDRIELTRSGFRVALPIKSVVCEFEKAIDFIKVNGKLSDSIFSSEFFLNAVEKLIIDLRSFGYAA